MQSQPLPSLHSVQDSRTGLYGSTRMIRYLWVWKKEFTHLPHKHITIFSFFLFITKNLLVQKSKPADAVVAAPAGLPVQDIQELPECLSCYSERIITRKKSGFQYRTRPYIVRTTSVLSPFLVGKKSGFSRGTHFHRIRHLCLHQGLLLFSAALFPKALTQMLGWLPFFGRNKHYVLVVILPKARTHSI